MGIGINYKPAKSVYIKSILSARKILRLSKNIEIRLLYHITSENNNRPDSLVNNIVQANPALTDKQISAKISTKQNQKISGITL